MESIAIIGMGCRFPKAKDPEAFWQLLRNGMDAITEVPPERWDVDAFYDPEVGTPGKMNTRWGGFLEQVDQFDPGFFGISPREAERMDPQQRLLLEVVWEALENAGLALKELGGSRTGVFIGNSNNDYRRLAHNEFSCINPYDATGNSLCIIANRVSYLFNLRGPSVAMDTACSSSLVALHLACQSLHNRESDLALAGGVNLILSPEGTITLAQARMLASDGRCKTFDARADGYVRGEGCGVVVLKRLSEVQRDRDNILAIIRGTAVNQDGLSNGLTAPNGLAQQEVIRQALENAGVAPAQIGCVEAQGTGTSLGDVIEMKSLKSVLLRDRLPEQLCWIGSVKTNIGHLEGASGIAAFIKIVLSLQHREIPPHLHLTKLNPYLSLADIPLTIPTALQPWPETGGQRFASVSAFGFGGTNVHVVVQEAPAALTSPAENERPRHLLTLSAKSEDALQELAHRYATYLNVHPEILIAEVCFTANVGRSHFNHRLAVVAETIEQLRERLNAFTAGKETTGLVYGKVAHPQSPKIAFLFTGQVAPITGVGRELYLTQPTFRETIDRCDKILRPYLSISLCDILFSETICKSPSKEATFAQPALFALEYALAKLWRLWGVKPELVVGQDVGEYVAACVAGVFSPEDGLKLVAEREKLSRAKSRERVVEFEQRGLKINYAWPNAEIGLLSSITDELATAEMATPDYWLHHATPPVQIAAGMQALRQQGVEVFVEIGPQPHLLEMGRQSLTEGVEPKNRRSVLWLPSLCSGQSDWQQMLESVAALYVAGVPVDWSGFDRDYPRRRLQLPTYPFQRQRYWVDTKEVWTQTNTPSRRPELLTAEQPSAKQLELLQQLREASFENRQELLVTYIREQVAKVLGLSASQLEVHQPLNTMGLDSLMAAELKSRAETDLGVELPLEKHGEIWDVISLAAQVNEQLPKILLTSSAMKAKPLPEKSPSSSPNADGIPPEHYRFELYPEYRELKQMMHEMEMSGIANPYFKVHQGINNDTTAIGDRELINYSSYNYLSFSGDPAVSQAAKQAIERYGTSVSASRVASGERPLHRELESELADLVGAEDCIVYLGGHATNETTIGHLFEEGDLILHDSLIHNSIQQGCLLSGARYIPFPHDNWQALDKILQEQRPQYRRVLVIIEGVYSMDGDIPDLPKFIEVKKHHKTFLMVDEAHSIGVLGKHGRGIGEYFGVNPGEVDLWMGTLSKSFASCGGYIAGSKALVEYLKYTAPGFVYSVGMSPPNAGAALAAIRLLKAEPERVTRLHQRLKLFLELAQSRGLNTGASKDSPVIPIIVGSSIPCAKLSQALFNRGINVQPMIYPAVPDNAARLRFFITCTHAEEQIRFTVDAIVEELAKIQH